MRVWIENLENTGHERVTLNDQFLFTTVDVSNDKNSMISINNAIVDCRYEVLFELALNYMAKDQFRDSIVNAFAALERFMEHYLLACVIEKGIPLEQIQSFWKTIGSKSERQLGAYHTAVLLREGIRIAQIDAKAIELRNKIVHQGVLADRENTMKVLHAIGLNISHRIVSQTSNDFLLAAKNCEYDKRKPSKVVREISINPFLGSAFNLTNTENMSNNLSLHIKQIQKYSYNDAIATWPNKLV